MLAWNDEIYPELLQYPVYVSPKIDGIRALNINRELRSRTLKLFPNKHTADKFKGGMLSGFDGELVVGNPTDPDVYRNTNSAVMSIKGTPDVKWYVFDLHDMPHTGYSDRFDRLKEYVNSVKGYFTDIILVQHYMATSLKELLEIEQEYLSRGYEGVMIRKPDGLYKYGRSTLKEGGLLKLKRFKDSEAEIISVVEAQANNNEATINELGKTFRSSAKDGLSPKGMVGAFVVKDIKTGIVFNVGTGLTESERIKYWNENPVGKVITYKYLDIGIKEKPRHPSFVGFRDMRING